MASPQSENLGSLDPATARAKSRELGEVRCRLDILRIKQKGARALRNFCTGTLVELHDSALSFDAPECMIQP
eukprot:1095079-Pelagomonas_calceolata.AAC.1